jgi:hypothetical protein
MTGHTAAQRDAAPRLRTTAVQAGNLPKHLAGHQTAQHDDVFAVRTCRDHLERTLAQDDHAIGMVALSP